MLFGDISTQSLAWRTLGVESNRIGCADWEHRADAQALEQAEKQFRQQVK